MNHTDTAAETGERPGPLLIITVLCGGWYTFSWIFAQCFTFSPVLLYSGYLLTLIFALVLLAYIGKNCRTRGPRDLLKTVPGGNYTFGLAAVFLCFLICAAVTGVSRPGSFRPNLGPLYSCALSFFVLFPLGAWSAGEGREHILRHMLLILMVLDALWCCVGLYVAFSGRELEIFGSGIYMMTGVNFASHRLVLAANPNTTGMNCAAMIILCFFLMTGKGKTARILAVPCLIIFYLTLSLTDSRASILSCALGTGVAAGLWGSRFMSGKGSVPQILVTLALGLGVFVLFVSCRVIAYNFCVVLRPEGIQGPESSREIYVNIQSDPTSNSRLMIFRAALQALRDRPDILLHGCGPYNVSKVIGEYLYPVYTHNQFLEVMMSYGVISGGVYIVWLAALGLRSLRIGLAPHGKTAMAPRIMAVLLLVMVAANMAEATLLFYCYLSQALFALAAGFVCGSAVFPFKGEKNPRQGE